MNPQKFLIFILQFMIIQAGCSRATQNTSSCLPDSIDIIILEEANHIWDCFGSNIWQHFDPDSIPILLFHSPDQHWLFNHPNPPQNFQKVTMLNYSVFSILPGSEPLWNYFSATIWRIFSNWTAILPSYSAWISFCEQQKIPYFIFPPDKLVFISLHERFHAFQMRWLQDEFQNLYQISNFSSPPDSRKEALIDIAEKSEQADICIQEQNALYQAYTEQDAEISRKAVSEFFMHRNQRFMRMKKTEIFLEDYMELIEGTAEYIEFKLSEHLHNGYKPLQAISENPEFQNYRNTSFSPAQIVQDAKTGILTSDRVYTAGILLCLLLDRYSAHDWKRDVFRNYHDNKTSLCGLLLNCYESGK
ncbi:hypothetical protein JW935_11415 [candidate division KSB1 bacterium]|nr:hypothetical protein [candidate division KSB1 bacterium]